jgi:CheY-like chemotaxis protein
VDDQPAVARSIARALENEALIEVASSGAEALSKIERASFDLVVCDVMMPGMSGPQLFDRVRLLYPQGAPSFIFMSGGASFEEQASVEATGVRCLTKPLELDAVRALISGTPEDWESLP